MNLNFIVEVWEAITHNLSNADRVDAADSLVSLLIDNDFEAEDIKAAFRGHREVQSAVKDYADNLESDEDDESDEDNEYEE